MNESINQSIKVFKMIKVIKTTVMSTRSCSSSSSKTSNSVSSTKTVLIQGTGTPDASMGKGALVSGKGKND